MGTEASKSGAREELWQVMVGPAGCLMTRDELTAALAREDVHRSTLVRRPGAIRWMTAREGLDLPRTEQDRSRDVDLPNLPPPLEVRTRKKSTTSEKRSWRPTPGTLFGFGVLVFVSGAVLATSTASLTRSFDKPKAQQTVAAAPAVTASAPATATASAATTAPVIVSAVPTPTPTPAPTPAPTPRVESTAARAALLKPPPSGIDRAPPVAETRRPIVAPKKPRDERAPHAPPATAAAVRKHAPLRSAAKPAAPPPRKGTFAKHAPRTKAAPTRKAKRR